MEEGLGYYREDLLVVKCRGQRISEELPQGVGGAKPEESEYPQTPALQTAGWGGDGRWRCIPCQPWFLPGELEWQLKLRDGAGWGAEAGKGAGLPIKAPHMLCLKETQLCSQGAPVRGKAWQKLPFSFPLLASLSGPQWGPSLSLLEPRLNSST